MQFGKRIANKYFINEEDNHNTVFDAVDYYDKCADKMESAGLYELCSRKQYCIKASADSNRDVP